MKRAIALLAALAAAALVTVSALAQQFNLTAIGTLSYSETLCAMSCRGCGSGLGPTPSACP